MSEILLAPFMGTAGWMWLVFLAIVLVLLVIDLGLFHRKSHEIGVRESFSLSAFYIIISLIFGVWVWYELGQQAALEFYTGYVIEKSLSMDNLFVMAVVFSALKIPRKYQHRVLFWGILGVILMRGIMIAAGAALVHQFEWVLYIFGGFLVLTGVKLMFWEDKDDDHTDEVRDSAPVKFIKKTFRVTNKLHGEKFIVSLPVSNKKNAPHALYMTPLLLALVTIELADVVFAVDSVPAVFAITTDTFIVYTSNICAILGLRALFFALSAMMERFAYLKYSIAAVLVFIGAKIFVPLVSSVEKVPPELSLSVTLGLLAAGMVYSLYKTKVTK